MTQALRHGLYLATEGNALLVQACFRPWRLRQTRATRCGKPSETWDHSLRAWLLKLPSQGTKLQVVYRARPTGKEGANSDNSDVDEVLLAVDSATQASQTQLPRHEPSARRPRRHARRHFMALADKARRRTAATATPKPAQRLPIDVKPMARAAQKHTRPAPTFGQAEWTARGGLSGRKNSKTRYRT